MTPPRSAAGHLPNFSTNLNNRTMQLQSARGHCLMRATVQPSWPGALEQLMPNTTRCSSSASKSRVRQPGKRLGGATRAQQGPWVCCHSGHHASSLACRRAACPAKKRPSLRCNPMLCRLRGPSRTHLKRAFMLPSVPALHQVRKPSLRCFRSLSRTRSSSSRALATRATRPTLGNCSIAAAAHSGSASP